MKLREEEVSIIVDRMILDWKVKNLATFKEADGKIRQALNEAFIKELKVEDDLNADVDQMLEKYEKEFDSGTLDRRKMFQMVKNQLIKERKIIL